MKYAFTWILIVLECTCIIDVQGYGGYRDKIPNGKRVPHPCKPNYIWNGVGHQTSAGGGYRNPFGEDFAKAGHLWTKELCGEDSDGDGLTNGHELGDPNCTWSQGSLDPDSTRISHPGVCEPWNDPKCQKQFSWMMEACKPEKFTCDALNEVGVKNMTINFPNTSVPVEETTYVCMEFELDNTGDYHMVATQPIIDNLNVMHHAVIFGCETDTHPIRSRPHRCGMVASNECSQIINIWTLGIAGDCVHDKIGFRIGANGIRRVALQFHWNNPTLKTDYTDASGMIIYYTDTKRENDAGILTIGSSYFEIPPRSPGYEVSSTCPGSCTSSFITDKIHIVSAVNHMHYLGASQKIELFRNGKKVRDITRDAEFNYDSPVVYEFPSAIEVLPGDTLKTTCIFNSMNRDNVTFCGDATSDEMCFGFLTFYPKANTNNYVFCNTWKSIPYCAIDRGQIFDGCDLKKYSRYTKESAQLFLALNTSCFNVCTPECMAVIESNPCLKGDPRDFLDFVNSYSDLGREMKRLYAQCNDKLTTKLTTPANDDTTYTTKINVSSTSSTNHHIYTTQPVNGGDGGITNNNTTDTTTDVSETGTTNHSLYTTPTVNSGAGGTTYTTKINVSSTSSTNRHIYTTQSVNGGDGGIANNNTTDTTDVSETGTTNHSLYTTQPVNNGAGGATNNDTTDVDVKDDNANNDNGSQAIRPIRVLLAVPLLIIFISTLISL
ncbi:uncharacterized protein LOC126826385 [Patella vulgata]|uniref:uncharacterized protein LOC126826385 n=1 Tax=Patella vulgata TaxID=6465 RepID=UPI00218079B9|nr:uncharacterized protein LOC126826385 [Patella vulgata]